MIRASTKRFNKAHQRLARFLAASPSHRRLDALYNVGIVFAILGMLFAWALLSRTLFLTASPPTPPPPPSLIPKRDIVVKPIVPGITTPISDIPFIFLAVVQGQIVHELGHAIAAAFDGIPLLSAGFSIFLIFPSFFVSLPSIPTSTSTQTRRSLFRGPHSARLRIIAAGPFHNLLFYLALTALSMLCSFVSSLPHPNTGLDDYTPLHLSTEAGQVNWLTETLYQDISQRGRVVMYVDSSSALKPFLPTGSIITKLDDILLSSRLNDTWNLYLTSPSEAGNTRGWCVDAHTFTSAPSLCCPTSSPYDSGPPSSGATSDTTQIPIPMAHLSCFDSIVSPVQNTVNSIANPSSSMSRCLDPVPILTSLPPHTYDTNTDQYPRCDTVDDCPSRPTSTNPVCIRPRPSERLLRISIQVPCTASHRFTFDHPTIDGESTEHCETVLLWSGPRQEIYKQVQVTKFLPRLFPSYTSISFFPFWITEWLSTVVIEDLKYGVRRLFEYTQLATLSLYLFNLLPLPYLDGEHFLRALLDNLWPHESHGIMDDAGSVVIANWERTDELDDWEGQGPFDIELGLLPPSRSSTNRINHPHPSRTPTQTHIHRILAPCTFILRTTLTRIRRSITHILRLITTRWPSNNISSVRALQGARQTRRNTNDRVVDYVSWVTVLLVCACMVVGLLELQMTRSV